MLDDKPAVPHAYDDEFETTNLAAAWVRGGSTTYDDPTPIDTYAGFTTGHRTSHNGIRPSWWMAQCSSGQYFMLSKPVTVPADFCVWARLSMSTRYTTNATEDPEIGIALLADSAGSPDLNNRVMTYLCEASAGVQRTWAGKAVAGVFTVAGGRDLIPGSLANSAFHQPFCYVLIQKVSTTYNFAVGSPHGNWMFFASQTHASTMAHFAVIGNNNSTAAPGNNIVAIDFARFKAGKFLP